MNQPVALSAKTRQITGSQVKKLRRQGILPANIFGAKVKSQAIELDRITFEKIFAQVGETGLIDLSLDSEKKTRPVLISEIHFHPLTGEFLHVDLHQVDLTQAVTATVPVEMVGEAPAEKEHGGVILLAVNELEVEALPADLPDVITVDISGLTEIGQSIKISDLSLPGDITLELDPDTTLVTVQEQAEEEVVEETEAEVSEVETTEQGPTVEDADTEAQPETQE